MNRLKKLKKNEITNQIVIKGGDDKVKRRSDARRDTGKEKNS